MSKNEMIVMSNKSSTTVKAVLYNGVSPYSAKTKDDYVNEGCLVLESSEALALIEANEEIEYVKPWTEITESYWFDLYECLPPYRSMTIEDHHFFFVSEAYTGNIHTCCVCHKDRYYKSMRRLTTTYEDMIGELKSDIEKGLHERAE